MERLNRFALKSDKSGKIKGGTGPGADEVCDKIAKDEGRILITKEPLTVITAGLVEVDIIDILC